MGDRQKLILVSSIMLFIALSILFFFGGLYFNEGDEDPFTKQNESIILLTNVSELRNSSNLVSNVTITNLPTLKNKTNTKSEIITSEDLQIVLENSTINESEFIEKNNITEVEKVDSEVLAVSNLDPKKKVSYVVVKDGLFDFDEESLNQEELLETINDNEVEKIYVNKEYEFLSETFTDSLDIDHINKNIDYTGRGIKVAVLDTGIEEDHPFLKNKVVKSTSFVDNDPTDYNGHGTHIAGIIAGQNSQTTGVSPDASLYNVKVLSDSGYGSSLSIAKGIYWAVDPNGDGNSEDGADIISISIGSATKNPDSLINKAIDYAIGKGLVVVVASGNCGQGCGTFRGVTVPGSNKRVITVGATDFNKKYAEFSSGQSFGNYIKPDIVVPGVNIYSSDINSKFSQKSGTSMATPMVSGIVALLLEKDNSLSHKDVKSLLESTSIDIGDKGKDVFFGSGFVNVTALLGYDYNDTSIIFDENDDDIFEVDYSRIKSETRLIENDISSYRYLETKDIESEVDYSIDRNMAIYFNDDSLVYVKETIFYDSIDLERFVFDRYNYFEDYKEVDSYYEKDDKSFFMLEDRLFEVEIYDDDKSIFSEIISNYDDIIKIDNLKEKSGISSSKRLLLELENNDTKLEMSQKLQSFEMSSLNPNKIYKIKENKLYKYDLDEVEEIYVFEYDVREAGDYRFDFKGKGIFGVFLFDEDINELDFDVIASDSIKLKHTKYNNYRSTYYIAIYTYSIEKSLNPFYKNIQFKATHKEYKCKFEDTGENTCRSDKLYSIFYDPVCGNKKVFDDDCSDKNIKYDYNICSADKRKILFTKYRSTFQCSEDGCKGPDKKLERWSEECSSDTYCDKGECKKAIGFDLSDIRGKSMGYAGETEKFKVKVTNHESIKKTLNVELGVIPEKWASKWFGNNYAKNEVTNTRSPCPANKFYQSKKVTLKPGESESVTFEVKLQDVNTKDACNNMGSAWDKKFRVLVGTYKNANGGYFNYRMRDFKIRSEELPNLPSIGDSKNSESGDSCKYPFGTSSSCSCLNNACKFGDYCDDSGDFAKCKPIPTCRSNKECEKDEVCDLTNPILRTCIPEVKSNECKVIDKYSCGDDGHVYRCEKVGTHNKLILADYCTVNEKCFSGSVSTTKSCEYNGEFDLVVEGASKGVQVNTQVGDEITILVTLDADYNNVNFTYDSEAFNLKSGICDQNIFRKGEVKCVFEVVGKPGNYAFGLSNQFEFVNIIEDPYILYVTDIPQLYKRYSNLNDGGASVNVLISKLYEKAAFSKGIVYDLSKFKEAYHNYSFVDYDEPLIAEFSGPRNDYVEDVSRYIKGRCNGCKDVLIVGDDYVVPHAVKKMTSYEEVWFFKDKVETEHYYSDTTFTNYVKPLLSDFYELFKLEGKFQGKEILFILPDEMDQNLNDSLELFKQMLVDMEYKPFFTSMNGSDIYCRDTRFDNNLMNKSLILVGDASNNQAFNCYSSLSSEVGYDAIFMERNLWSNTDYALILNTNNYYTVDLLTELVERNQIVKLKSHDAYLFKVATERVRYVAMGVGIVALTVGTGGTGGLIGAAALMTEGVADLADVANECFVNNEGQGYCEMSVRFIFLPTGISAGVKKSMMMLDDVDSLVKLSDKLSPHDTYIKKNFVKMRDVHFGKSSWEHLFDSIDDVDHFAKGSKILFGDVAEDLSKIKGKFPIESMITQGEIIKSVGRTSSYIDSISDLNKKKYLKDKFNAFLAEFQRKGNRFEVEGFNFIELENLDDFSVKIKHKQVGAYKTPNNDFTDVDKLLKNGKIIEEKSIEWKYLLKEKLKYDPILQKKTMLSDFERKLDALVEVQNKVFREGDEITFIFKNDNFKKINGYAYFPKDVNDHILKVKRKYPKKKITFEVVDSNSKKFFVKLVGE